MKILHRDAIGRAARHEYPSHARHGVVDHEVLESLDAIAVRCECGEPLLLSADLVYRYTGPLAWRPRVNPHVAGEFKNVVLGEWIGGIR